VWFVFSLASYFPQITVAQNTGALPPIIHYVLQDSTLLEQVLTAYETPSSNHIFIAAHRGGKEFDVAEMAPGNSIANIENALSKRFDLYESDIEILGDGTLVVFHDPTFDNLTNTSIINHTLDDATIGDLNNLFLTYSDDSVSNQKVPTLDQFLTAIKGKLMVKFDLKSGTFGTSTLIKIMQTAVSTGTTEQVLIRGGNNLLSVANNNGFDTRMIMLRYDTAPSVADINAVANGPPVRAISIPGGATAAIMSAANAAGLVVEVHESQGVSNMQLELDWQAALDNGVRQFHSFKPSLLKAYLVANGYRRF